MIKFINPTDAVEGAAIRTRGGIMSCCDVIECHRYKDAIEIDYSHWKFDNESP